MKIVWFLFILLASNTEQFDPETCQHPLGLETGKILDSAFSTSSTGENVVAYNARIRSETDGWCPTNEISSSSNEYLQIDLVNLTVITLIELQGKFSQQPNEQFADSFRIEYRREQDQSWIRYKNFAGQHILSGNTNSHIPAMREILPAFVALQIRILPLVTGATPKRICMRLELYGCSYQDGPIAYSIPQGDKRGYDVQFIDETYDGYNENGTLKGGLGQLTDGILGGDDYRQGDGVQGIGQFGYDWIGWKRKPSMPPHIDLYFRFSTIRNFTTIHVHTSNLFTRDVHLFDSITISTTIQCENEYKNINRRSYLMVPNDQTSIHARFIHVSLASGYGLVGQCLKLTLTFGSQSKWLLISEIRFDSKPISIPTMTTTTTTHNHLSPMLDNEVSYVQYWHWLLLAGSLLILFFVILIVVYLQYSHMYRRRQRKLCNTRMTAHLKFDSTYQPILMKFPSRSRMGCCYVTTGDSTTSSDGNSTCSILDHARHRLIISTTSTTAAASPTGGAGSDFSTIGTSSPATMSTVYQSIVNPYLTAVSNDTPNVTSNPYASIDVYASPMIPSCVDKMSWKSIQGPCGNSTLEMKEQCPSTLTKLHRLSDEQLIIEERYSTMDNCYGTIVRGYIYLRHPHDVLKPILIKALTGNDLGQKDAFNREHELLNCLNHSNLVQFFGYTLKQNYAIIEHSDLGDLYTYLLSSQSERPILSTQARLLIMTQLSNALRYLESRHVVHRDLAARNCLIYQNFEIKLTHVAMASAQFQSHYYSNSHSQCRLPIRWMAPESIVTTQFTSQSDAWSFGITLWEVMTNCATLPYSSLTDEEVYRRLETMAMSMTISNSGLQLSKPECLSKELVDLMLECWRPYGQRPTFNEIFAFFNKRVDGIAIV